MKSVPGTLCGLLGTLLAPPLQRFKPHEIITEFTKFPAATHNKQFNYRQLWTMTG